MNITYCYRCGRRNDVEVWPIGATVGFCTCPREIATNLPPSDYGVVAHNLITEEKLREMVRAMVAEELAKLQERQSEVANDEIISIACEFCGEQYTGSLLDVPRGWYGFIEQEPVRKDHAFCSEEHMKQWKTKQGILF